MQTDAAALAPGIPRLDWRPYYESAGFGVTERFTQWRKPMEGPP